MDESKMKPIIFNTEMVKAILDGSKVCTRRPFSKTNHKYFKAAISIGELCNFYDNGLHKNDPDYMLQFAPYSVGDMIYVRESFRIPDYVLGYDNGFGDFGYGYATVKYIADGSTKEFCLDDEDWEKQEDQVEKFSENNKVGNQPSIFMPKWASRIHLKVTDVKIDRVQDITDSEAIKEGIKDNSHRHSPRFQFTKLWDSIYGDFSENPWLWVIDFEVISNG